MTEPSPAHPGGDQDFALPAIDAGTPAEGVDFDSNSALLDLMDS
jgi:hypothetical protein